jgi:poly(A) polymerase
VTAGPKVATTLRKVEDAWVAEGFPDRGRVLELLDAILSQ